MLRTGLSILVFIVVVSYGTEPPRLVMRLMMASRPSKRASFGLSVCCAPFLEATPKWPCRAGTSLRASRCHRITLRPCGLQRDSRVVAGGLRCLFHPPTLPPIRERYRELSEKSPKNRGFPVGNQAWLITLGSPIQHQSGDDVALTVGEGLGLRHNAGIGSPLMRRHCKRSGIFLQRL